MMNRRHFVGSLSRIAAGSAAAYAIPGARAVAGSVLSAAAAEESIVETAAGKIRGRVDSGVHVFKGVPYGASTAGKMRFMPPAKPTPWSGVRDAFEYGPMAPQVLNRNDDAATARQSEDCLVLNVWTRGLNDGGRRPVMFFCHGNGFTGGSGSSPVFDGVNLSNRGDVVVVTINHRLNVFGFLHLGDLAGHDYAVSGNAGMLDIVAALTWVRDNIARLGGDPNNVTIFGQSAGGRKVSTLMTMPGAKGLFHRAIIESGPGLQHSRHAPRDMATELALELLVKLELKPSQIGELHSVPAERLVAAFDAVDEGLDTSLRRRGVFLQQGFGPTLDGTILPGYPFDPAAPAVSADIPLLIGSNRHETAANLRGDAKVTSRSLSEDELRARVEVLAGSAAERVLAVYRQEYPQASPAERYILLTTFRSFVDDTLVLTQRKHAQGKAPVYSYRFTWETPVNGGRMLSHHGLELSFVFDNTAKVPGPTGGGPEAAALADKMSDAWIAFARTGNPATPKLPWPAYSSGTRAAMVFNNECGVVNDPLAAERHLWATI